MQKTTTEKTILAKASGRTQEKFKNDMAKGMTAVPMTAANQAGLKCSVRLLGVNLNGSAIHSSIYVLQQNCLVKR
ncbi:MAG: hypothetical protein OQK50_06990 [Deltaproteobacteria bacterium]|nr:hypothetical protein [Deltaproteobacteria bacterium]MCW8892265.1 hypothetical protein [Deltaproteobacteria bacterium]MCW9050058.1 hypothetical protein [Deltaproteobacteria bacterium]